MRQPVSVLLVSVLLVGSIIAPFGIGLTGNSEAVPSGMTGVPSEQVTEDLPPEAHGLRGEVLASNGAGTLEVISTTSERASDHVGGRDITPGGRDVTPGDDGLSDEGEFALVLRDTENEAGRQIAVDKQSVEANLGYTPEVAWGVHESGERWASEVQVEDGYLLLDVPHFSTNTVTFSSTVNIQGDSAVDGTSYSYDLDDADSTSDANVTLTGVQTSEWDNVSVIDQGDGDTHSLDIAGNLDPTDTTATLTGRTTSTAWSSTSTGVTNGYTETVTVPGNVDPINQEVTFTGREQTSAASTSATALGDGASTSYTVGGNLPATDAGVTFTGREDTNSRTVSGSGSPSLSTSYSVGGNLQPTDGSGGNPELTVTGYSSSASYNVVNNLGDGGVDGNHEFVGDTSANGDLRTEVEFNPNSDGQLQDLTLDIGRVDGSDYGPTVDIYLVQGGADASVTQDTLVKSDWDPSFSTGSQTVTLDSTPTVTSGQDYHLEFVTSGTDSDDVDDKLYLGVDYDSNEVAWASGGEALGTQQIYGDMSYTVEDPVTSLSASTDDGASASFGDFNDGETKTRTLDLSTSSSSLDFSASSGESIDYTLSFAERTGTEDPSVDVDGDGTTDASYSGVLSSGQTHSESVSDIPSGSQTATVGLTAGSTDLDIDYTERTATEDPEVDVNGDGSTDATLNGILTSGETHTVSVSELSHGDNSLEYYATTGAVDYEVSADAQTASEDPSVDLDGDGTAEVAHTGILADGESTSSTASLTTADDTATVSTASGSTVDVSTTIRERTVTEDPEVDVNGCVVSHSGVLSEGETASLSVDSGCHADGTNTVTINILDGLSGDAATSAVGFNYAHDASTSQSVEYRATKWTERYNVSQRFASDRSDATLTIPFDSSSVVEVAEVEMRVNGGTWSEVPESEMDFTNTELTVLLGSVNSGDIIEVRGEGRKVSTVNGEITVTNPTVPGDSLDTEIQVDDRSSGFYIDVQGGINTRLHYTTEESWSGTPYIYLDDTEEQRLLLPDANAGSTARVRTLPVDINPSSEIETVVEDPSQPTFRLRQGSTGGSDRVEVDYYGGIEGDDYELYSITNDLAVTTGTVSDGEVTFSTDDSSQTYAIQEYTESSGAAVSVGGSGGAAGGSSGSGLPIFLLVVGVGVALVGTVYVGRRLGFSGRVSNILLVAVGGIVGYVAIEAVSARSVSADIIFNAGRALAAFAETGAGTLSLGIGIMLALYLLDSRTRFTIPRWLYIMAGLGVGTWTLNNILNGALADGLSEVSSLVWLLLVGGGLILLWRALQPTVIQIQGEQK